MAFYTRRNQQRDPKSFLEISGPQFGYTQKGQGVRGTFRRGPAKPALPGVTMGGPQPWNMTTQRQAPALPGIVQPASGITPVAGLQSGEFSVERPDDLGQRMAARATPVMQGFTRSATPGINPMANSEAQTDLLNRGLAKAQGTFDMGARRFRQQGEMDAQTGRQLGLIGAQNQRFAPQLLKGSDGRDIGMSAGSGEVTPVQPAPGLLADAGGTPRAAVGAGAVALPVAPQRQFKTVRQPIVGADGKPVADENGKIQMEDVMVPVPTEEELASMDQGGAQDVAPGSAPAAQRTPFFGKAQKFMQFMPGLPQVAAGVANAVDAWRNRNGGIQPQPAAPAAQPAAPARPTTKAEYDALPPGSQYIDPQTGKVSTKRAA